MCHKFDILLFIIYCALFRSCTACYETYRNETKLMLQKNSTNFYQPRYRGRYRFETVISSSTITCSNIYSMKEIFYTYKNTDYEQFLNVTSSNITKLLPNDFSQFATIKKLYLTGNYIEEILPDAFSGLIELEELYLNKNNLSQIVKTVFEFLDLLERLDLSKNRIKIIENQAFENLEKLQILDLSENYLSRIDAKLLTGLKKIFGLLLGGNPLVGDFNDIVSTDVDFLDLSQMNLTKFENLNFTNHYMTYVNLGNNSISSVNLSLYPKTRILFLKNNKIKRLEGSNSILSELYMAGNKLEVLNNFFLNETVLTFLDLSFNQIHTIHVKAFAMTPVLEKLILHHNKISQLKVGTFQDLKYLKILDLSHNDIKEIEFGIFGDLSLKILNASYNNLEELHEHTLDSLESLEILNFDFNNITQFNASSLVKHLHLLRNVSLDGNPWKCKILGNIISVLKLSRVTVTKGLFFNVENLNGIPCSKDNNTEIVSSKQDINFGKMLNDTIKESFAQILKEEFNKSEFQKSLHNSKLTQEYNSSKPEAKPLESVQPPTSNNGILIFNLILQLFMCLILLVIIFLVIRFLRKSKRNDEFQLITNE